MGRARKSPSGALSRQYIYNLRSELNELNARLESEPQHSKGFELRIAEIRELLGPEVVPFRDRQREQKLIDKEFALRGDDSDLELLKEVIHDRKNAL